MVGEKKKGSWVDRRRTFRVQVADVDAVGSTTDSAAVYKVKNLSMGGALLEGKPSVSPGSPMVVQLNLPTHPPITLESKVLRSHSDVGRVPQLAIAFAAINAVEEDVIRDFVAGEFCTEHGPIALVADASPTEGEALASALRAIGCLALRVSTPLEAIQRLHTPGVRVSTVFFGPRVGRVESSEFAAFLADVHPTIHRVLIGEAKRTTGPKVAQATLTKPWTRERLKRMMGGSGD